MTAVPIEMTVEFHSGSSVCSHVNTDEKLSNVGLSGHVTPTVAVGLSEASTIHARGTRNVRPMSPRITDDTHREVRPRGEASAVRSLRVGGTTGVLTGSSTTDIQSTSGFSALM